jgi:putative ABC transport system ATP-binding protein
MLYTHPARTSRETRSRASRVLQEVGLGDRLDHIPSQLSGGQQQRVAIARALVLEPALLLADEPTGNLDTRTSIEIMGVFQQLNATGMTVVMVTHELDIASYTRRTVVMRDGRIVSDKPVTNRLIASQELEKLNSAESAANLAEAAAVR